MRNQFSMDSFDSLFDSLFQDLWRALALKEVDQYCQLNVLLAVSSFVDLASNRCGVKVSSYRDDERAFNEDQFNLAMAGLRTLFGVETDRQAVECASSVITLRRNYSTVEITVGLDGDDK